MLKIDIYYRTKTHQMMKRKHYNAHQTHKVRGLVLSVITSICVLIKIYFLFGFVYWRFCVEEQRTECDSINVVREEHNMNPLDCVHMYRKDDIVWIAYNSWCHTVYTYMDIYSDPTYSWVQTCLVDLPVFWAFFLLNQPHDCFRCLGKDPDRVFSIT